jgi:hypothetical protein
MLARFREAVKSGVMGFEKKRRKSCEDGSEDPERGSPEGDHQALYSL